MVRGPGQAEVQKGVVQENFSGKGPLDNTVCSENSNSQGPWEHAAAFPRHRGARAARAEAGGGRESRQSQRAEPDKPLILPK